MGVNRPRRPVTESVTGGHNPSDHLGSLKPPIYETSTFVFETAEDAKQFFQNAYALEGASAEVDTGYIYSRLDSPNLKSAEHRLAIWEGAEEALLFNSGTSAIFTVFLEFLHPGDVLLYSSPLYGGTGTMIHKVLAKHGVEARPFGPTDTADDLREMGGDRVAMVYVETPSNPTNDLFDLAMASEVAKSYDAVMVVDNTFLSPIWQQPISHGADISLHSATKYLGGHSDLTAGAIVGRSELMERLRHLRYRIGTTASPQTGWLLARSLETLRLRVERQTANATKLAAHLDIHPKVVKVRHLSLLTPDDTAFDTYKRQCLGPGAMISFDVAGGEPEVFRFLNKMELVRLTVSLGGTESLASHPWSTTHSTVTEADKQAIGIGPGLVRFSVGIEDADDLIADLDHALSFV